MRSARADTSNDGGAGGKQMRSALPWNGRSRTGVRISNGRPEAGGENAPYFRGGEGDFFF